LSQLKIDYCSLEFPFEDKNDNTAFYKGEEFSGIVYENHKDYYWEYEYKNGIEDGKIIGIITSTKEVIEKGNHIKGRKEGEYYRYLCDKKIKVYENFSNDLLIHQEVYNLNGTLIKKYSQKEFIDHEFYDDGSIYFIRTFKDYKFDTLTYYLNDQILCKRFEWDKKKKKFRFEFYTSVFFKNIDSLNSVFHWYPVRWFVDDLLENDKELALKFLLLLLNHKDVYFVGDATYYLGQLGDKRALHELKKFTKKREVAYVYPRFSELQYGALSINCSNVFTNGDRAIKAIKKIKKKNAWWRIT